MGRILLIDGSNTAFRAKFAYPDLTSPEGTPTSVIFGFINILRATLEELGDITKTIVIWDSGRAPFRKKLYPEYKEKRKGIDDPDEKKWHYWQLDKLGEILPQLGVPSLIYRGEPVEADDIIAFLTLRVFFDAEVVISSTDQDFLQLISPTVTVHRSTSKSTVVNHENFPLYAGVGDIETYRKLRWMTGDSSDNIKPLPGVGEITARKLLAKCQGDLEYFYNSIEDLETRQEVTGIINRNKKLMDLNYGVDQLTENVVKFLKDPATLAVNKNDESLRSIFHELAFTSLLSRFGEWIAPFRNLCSVSGD